MSRLAFISDIHSNLPALEAVVQDIASRNVESIYCLGDIIGYHSFPGQVIDLLKKHNVVSIKGNHDEMITGGHFNRQKESDFVKWWNADALNAEDHTYLLELPGTLFFEQDGIGFELSHGSPADINEYLYFDSEEADKALDSTAADILLCAHTHIPGAQQKGDTLLLNPGSVGKPKIGRPNATYLIVDTAPANTQAQQFTVKDAALAVEFFEVTYEVDKIIDDLKAKGFPKKLMTALATGIVF